MENKNSNHELVSFVAKVIPKGWKHPIGFYLTPEEISARVQEFKLRYIREAAAAFKNRKKIYDKQETKNAR